MIRSALLAPALAAWLTVPAQARAEEALTATATGTPAETAGGAAASAIGFASTVTGTPVEPAGGSDFDFFREERDVTSASRRPSPVSRAPSTVYVVTHEEIRASGARTIWDALRAVPGVDVIESRAFQADVSIRGMDQALSNQILVLLDGKTVLNGYFDVVFWEEIPVSLDEIDRIEVMEGPGSALYGANAVMGVINIITRTPAQIAGGQVQYAAGTRRTQLADAFGGDRAGPLSWKAGTSWRTTNQFADPDRVSSRANKAHAYLGYDFSDRSTASIAGGIADIDTELSAGNNGPVIADGPSGFLRVDGSMGTVRARAFWNAARQVAREFVPGLDPGISYDTWDLSCVWAPEMPEEFTLDLGAGWRTNLARSVIFSNRAIHQDLWSGFGEAVWRPAEPLSLVASGRADHHPLAGLVISPRASAVLEAIPGHTIRVSAGTAFRNPTLLENYLDFTQDQPNAGSVPPNPPFETIEYHLVGNRGLDPEKLREGEIAYSGRFGSSSLTLTAYRYVVGGTITRTLPQEESAVPPVYRVRDTYFNAPGAVRGAGGEAAVETRVSRGLTAFSNYALLRISDDLGLRNREAPRHKLNGGIRWKSGPLAAGVWAHWVDHTEWVLSAPSESREFMRVPAYWLLNVSVRCTVDWPLPGASLGISGFNALNDVHAEILPARDAMHPGQAGEVIKSRWTVDVTWAF